MPLSIIVFHLKFYALSAYFRMWPSIIKELKWLLICLKVCAVYNGC